MILKHKNILILFVIFTGVIASLFVISANPAQAACPVSGSGVYCTTGTLCGGTCVAQEPTCSGGKSLDCSSCGCVCPSGQIDCGGTCQAPKTCSDNTRVTSNQCTGACGDCKSGYITDPASPSGPCIAPTTAYMNFANSGYFSVSGDLKSAAGDLYLIDSKAIRLDKSGAPTMLNIGNFLATSGTVADSLTGASIAVPTQPVSVNIFGNLTIRNPAGVSDKGKLIADQICFGADCKTAWAQVGGAGGSSQWTTSGSSIYYNSGNVGIGTDSPGSLLHLRSATTDAGLKIESINNEARLILSYGQGNQWTLKNLAGILQISHNGAERLRIDGSGNIGIGNNDPKAKLDVAGDLRVSGCFGPVFVGMTSSSYDSNQGGYYSVNNLCKNTFSGSHVCTTVEMLNSINCEKNLGTIIGESSGVWVTNGAPSLPTPTNDCQGWTTNDSSWKGIHYVYDPNGGKFYAKECSATLKIACCK